MTTLVRWNPALETDPFQQDMNRLFDAFFRAAGNGNGSARWQPAMDLGETEEAITLTADLPGVREEDIAVEVKDGTLTVAGERKDERRQDGAGFHRTERRFGRFSRSLALPRGIDAESVQADFTDGVLEIRIPKPEERKPHRVRIGAGSSAPAIEGEASERVE